MVIGSATRACARLVPLLAIAVAACVPSPPKPTPVPQPTRAAPRPVPVPTPTQAADWQDWPRTEGDWRYERDARGSRALFGTAGQDALAVLRCDRDPARITLSRTNGGAAVSSMTIRTTSQTRAVRASASTGGPSYAMAALAPNDRLLDAIAFTRGRFTVELPGAAPLVLPPWAEVNRVIEDCRG